MSAVLDLINLYSDINREIIEENLDRKGMSESFKRATDFLINIRNLLQQLPLEGSTGIKNSELTLDLSNTSNLIERQNSTPVDTVWSYFKADASLN